MSLEPNDHERLHLFSRRVDGLDDVTVYAERGPNPARLEQIWCVESPPDGFVAEDLLEELLERLDADHSTLHATVLVVRRGGSPRALDSVRLPPNRLTPTKLDPVAFLTQTLSHTTNVSLRTAEQDKFEARAQYDQLQARFDALSGEYLSSVRELGELRALSGAGLLTEDLNKTAPRTEMQEALQMLKAGLMLAIPNSVRPPAQLTDNRAAEQDPQDDVLDNEPVQVGDRLVEIDEAGALNELASKDPEVAKVLSEQDDKVSGAVAEQRTAVHDVLKFLGVALERYPELLTDDRRDALRHLVGGPEQVQVPDVDVWTDELADEVVSLVEEVATNHLELITDEDLERLVPVLQGPVMELLAQ